MKRGEAIVASWLQTPAPGLPPGDRIKRRLIEACEAVSRDIAQQGAVSYETVEQVRAVLALAGLT